MPQCARMSTGSDWLLSRCCHSDIVIECIWVPDSALRVFGTEQKWRKHSEAVREALNMPLDARPWTSRTKPQGVPANARPYDVLDTIYQRWLNSHPEASELLRLGPDLFADWSQAVQRCPGAECHPLGAHQANGDYSYEANRCLTAEESFCSSLLVCATLCGIERSFCDTV